MRPSILLAMASLVGLCGHAAALELKAEDPDFIVSVPKLPSMRLETQATSNTNVSKTLAGTDGTHKISLVVTKSGRETSTRECAGMFLRSLLARPEMPDRDNVYRTVLDEDTFLVLYVLVEQGTQQLHAHLLSSANASHCIEMHVSRARRDGEDGETWRQSFAGSHVQDARR